MLSNNRVIVRIWHSTFSGGAGVGHVAVETENPRRYMSFWPTADGKKCLGVAKSLVTGIEHTFAESYAEDKEDEKRDSETVICLYSLNVEDIIEEYDKLRKMLDSGGQNWSVGGTFFSKKQHSCASLARDILIAGSLESLLPDSGSSTSDRYSSTATPAEVLKLVKMAKQTEKERYPETEGFYFEGETCLSYKVKQKACCIL
jgi:hypothetical protein